MNNILRSVVIVGVMETVRAYGKVALKAEFEWNWNMQNVREKFTENLYPIGHNNCHSLQ